MLAQVGSLVTALRTACFGFLLGSGPSAASSSSRVNGPASRRRARTRLCIVPVVLLIASPPRPVAPVLRAATPPVVAGAPAGSNCARASSPAAGRGPDWSCRSSLHRLVEWQMAVLVLLAAAAPAGCVARELPHQRQGAAGRRHQHMRS